MLNLILSVVEVLHFYLAYPPKFPDVPPICLLETLIQPIDIDVDYPFHFVRLLLDNLKTAKYVVILLS